MPRIFISPSTQEANRGVSPFTTEEIEMNKIADLLIPLLNSDGRFITARNTPNMSIYQSASASNNFKADIHIAIHSDAGGGEGTTIFAYGANTNSEKLAKALYNQVAPLSPGNDRGIKFKPEFVEVGDRVHATAVLIEVAFHDNAVESAWMVNNRLVIARSLYRGICDFYSYDYKSLIATPTVQQPSRSLPSIPTAEIYRVKINSVQLSAWENKNTALSIAQAEYNKATSGTRITIEQKSDSKIIYDQTVPTVAIPTPQQPSRSLPSTPIAPTPISKPQVTLKFSYPNNAKVINDTLYIRDANGNRIPNRYVSIGDEVTIIDISGSKQLIYLEYNGGGVLKSGFVKNVPSCIKYKFLNQYRNGSTPETVYADDCVTKIGELNKGEVATILFRKNGFTNVVYNITGYTLGKSGFVKFGGL